MDVLCLGSLFLLSPEFTLAKSQVKVSTSEVQGMTSVCRSATGIWDQLIAQEIRHCQNQ